MWYAMSLFCREGGRTLSSSDRQASALSHPCSRPRVLAVTVADSCWNGAGEGPGVVLVDPGTEARILAPHLMNKLIRSAPAHGPQPDPIHRSLRSDGGCRGTRLPPPGKQPRVLDCCIQVSVICQISVPACLHGRRRPTGHPGLRSVAPRLAPDREERAVTLVRRVRSGWGA